MNIHQSLFLLIPGAIIGCAAVISGTYFAIRWVLLIRKLNKMIELVDNKLVVVCDKLGNEYNVRLEGYESVFLNMYKGRSIRRLEEGILKAEESLEKLDERMSEPGRHFQKLRTNKSEPMIGWPKNKKEYRLYIEQLLLPFMILGLIVWIIIQTIRVRLRNKRTNKAIRPVRRSIKAIKKMGSEYDVEGFLSNSTLRIATIRVANEEIEERVSELNRYSEELERVVKEPSKYFQKLLPNSQKGDI